MSKETRQVAVIILAFVGVSIVIWFSHPGVALGMVIMIWANNLEHGGGK